MRLESDPKHRGEHHRENADVGKQEYLSVDTRTWDTGCIPRQFLLGIDVLAEREADPHSRCQVVDSFRVPDAEWCAKRRIATASRKARTSLDCRPMVMNNRKAAITSARGHLTVIPRQSVNPGSLSVNHSTVCSCWPRRTRLTRGTIRKDAGNQEHPRHHEYPECW
jgi:hypothetical protein